ncbi:MAG: hypothetical protein R3F59_38170 [Myxococcota bacterium]
MMGWLGICAWLLGASGTARAEEPVFVPDFTPEKPEDFAVSSSLQAAVTERLAEADVLVLTGDMVAPKLGGNRVERCAERLPCPSNLLPDLPTRIAVVARVEHDEHGTLVGHVYLFQTAVTEPVDSMYIPIAPGDEAVFSGQVASAVRALIAQLGPPEPEMVAQALALAGKAAPPPAPWRRQALRRLAAPHRGPRHDPRGHGRLPRHLYGSIGAFRKSGLDPRDWLYRAMPHAGRLAFEVRGGLGLGDIDRVGDVRVEQIDGEQTSSWYQEGPAPSRNVRGALFVGYAPATMIDLGVLVGLQYGNRTLTTQALRVSPTETTGGERTVLNPDTAPDEYLLDALNLYLQPRVRLYVVPLGPAKPYVVTGADLRFFDRYQIDQPANLVYPSPPGGLIPGWLGGGGMMIDPGPIVGFFAEGTYVRHFGPLSAVRSDSFGDPWTHAERKLPATDGITVSVTGGVQFRL